jgi:hypothetical protein
MISTAAPTEEARKATAGKMHDEIHVFFTQKCVLFHRMGKFFASLATTFSITFLVPVLFTFYI